MTSPVLARGRISPFDSNEEEEEEVLDAEESAKVEESCDSRSIRPIDPTAGFGSLINNLYTKPHTTKQIILEYKLVIGRPTNEQQQQCHDRHPSKSV